MTYSPTPRRCVLLLRPAKYATGDGYGAFGPDGDRLLDYWRAHGAKVAVREIDVTTGAWAVAADQAPAKADMRERFKRTLAVLSEHHTPFDTLVIACHGWTTGLSIGVTVKNVGTFANALIAAGLEESANIFLAACSAGSGSHEGDRSVADALRDALAARGRTYVVVYAHTTAGEALRNPYVRVFRGNGQALPLEGGAYLVSPKSPAFKAWSKSMARKTPGPNGFLWCRFFDMDDEQLAAEIGA